MTELLLVGAGGFLGSIARYALGLWIVGRVGVSSPLPTLAINVTGSLAIGVLFAVLAARAVADPAWRLFLAVGFLGGYTTFSSYSLEAVALIGDGRWSLALWYVLASNGLSLAGTALGFALGRLVGR